MVKGKLLPCHVVIHSRKPLLIDIRRRIGLYFEVEERQPFIDRHGIVDVLGY